MKRRTILNIIICSLIELIFVLGLIFVIYSSSNLKENSQRFIKKDLENESYIFLDLFKKNYNKLIKAIYRLNHRMAQNEPFDKVLAEKDISHYLFDYGEILSISYLDQGDNIQIHVAKKLEIEPFGNKYKNLQKLKRLIKLSQFKGHTEFADIVKNPDGTFQQYVVFPIFIKGKVVGTLLVLIDLTYMTSRVNSIHRDMSYRLILASKKNLVRIKRKSNYGFEKRINLHGKVFHFESAPQSFMLRENRISSTNYMLMFFVAIGIVFLANFVLFVISIQLRRRLDAKEELIRKEKNRHITMERSESIKLKRYKKAINSGKIGIWIWDLVSDRLIWNQNMYALYDVPDDAFVSYELWKSTLLDADKNSAELKVKLALEGRKEFNTTFRVLTSASIKYIKAFGTVERNERGDPINFVGINFDVTEMVQATEICKEVKVIFWEVNLKNETISLSSAGSFILQLAFDELCCISLSRWKIYLNEADREKFVENIETFIQSNAGMEPTECRFVLKNRETRWLKVFYIDSYQDAHNSIVKGIFQDVTQEKKQSLDYEDKAFHDTLTKHLNRNGIMHELNKLTRVSKRQNDKFAVVFLDLDNLKVINDNYGHAAGDELIKESARRIVSTVRDCDHFGRIGGDEFIILIERVVSKKIITMIVKKIIKMFEAPFYIDGREYPSSVSIGIAMYPADGTTGKTLLKNSDAAMYKVKQTGKNNFSYFSKNLLND